MRTLARDVFLVVDTREIRTKQFHIVDRDRAMAALVETRPGQPGADWALENGVAVQIGDVVVPLAVANRALFGRIFDPAADERQSELGVVAPAMAGAT